MAQMNSTRKCGYRIYAKSDRSQADCDLREMINRRNRYARQGARQDTLDYFDARIVEKRAQVIAIHGSEVNR